MTLQETIRAKMAIKTIALKENKSEEEVRKVMQEALDVAWMTTWMPGNIPAQVRWQQLFKTSSKPSLEELIINLAEIYRK